MFPRIQSIIIINTVIITININTSIKGRRGETQTTKTLLLSLQAYSTAQYVYPDWELYLPEGG